MKLRKSRTSRRGRIEIIPMIDVMFFLLVTFLLASLSMQNLNSISVKLPQGKAAALQSNRSITLSVTRDGGIFLNQVPVTLQTLADDLRPMLRDADANVVVAADDAAPQGTVVKAMLQARRAGAQRFLIAVKRDE